MHVAGIVASTLVGLVLVVSGASKWHGREAWPGQAAEFGAPRWVVPLLPPFELALGAMLAARLGLPWSAWVAAALLVAFTGAIAWRLAAGRRPSCGCFGAWSVRPIGRRHLVRNGVLIALAVVAAVL